MEKKEQIFYYLPFCQRIQTGPKSRRFQRHAGGGQQAERRGVRSLAKERRRVGACAPPLLHVHARCHGGSTLGCGRGWRTVKQVFDESPMPTALAVPASHVPILRVPVHLRPLSVAQCILRFQPPGTTTFYSFLSSALLVALVDPDGILDYAGCVSK
jgi:hypothetical protein